MYYHSEEHETKQIGELIPKILAEIRERHERYKAKIKELKAKEQSNGRS